MALEMKITMENNYNMTEEGNRNMDTEFICDFVDFLIFNGVFLILIFILSVIGNILLMYILVFYENLKNVPTIFVLNLACSDLIFALTLPFWATEYLHHWIFGKFLCKFITWAYFVGLYSSIITLTAMTVERFIAVVLYKWSNSHFRQRKYAIGVCVAAWFISFATSVVDAMKVEVNAWDNALHCGAHDDADVVYYVQLSLLFFLPFAINIVCNCAIIKTVVVATSRKKKRAVALVLCVVTAFFICWGPFNIMLLIMSFYKPHDCKSHKQLDVALNICRMLAFTHCCTNPLLFMLSQKLRKHFLRFLSCETGCWRTNANQNVSVTQNIAYSAQISAVVLELHNK